MQLECKPCAARMQAQCSWNAGPVQLPCRPSAARMQSLHSLIAGPVQLEGRPRVRECRNRAAGMHAQCRSSAACSAARGNNQCQRQGKIIPWRPEPIIPWRPEASSSAKARSYLGALRQQPDHTLAPQASSQLQRQGKIMPWRLEPAGNAGAKVRS